MSRMTIRLVHPVGWHLFCRIQNAGRRPGLKGGEGED